MPTTIVAHLATSTIPIGDRHSFPRLAAALLGEFAEAPLYADISALTAWGKIRFLRKIAGMQELHAKLLFGSDFPVPLAMPRIWRDLRRRLYSRIAAERSWPQRAVQIYRHFGFNEIVFHRAAMLLPNVYYFTKAG